MEARHDDRSWYDRVGVEIGFRELFEVSGDLVIKETTQ